MALRFEGEQGRFERVRGTNTLSVRPISAPGLGFSTANRWYVTSDGDIRYVTTANISANDRSAAAGTVVSLMEGQSAVVSIVAYRMVGTPWHVSIGALAGVALAALLPPKAATPLPAPASAEAGE